MIEIKVRTIVNTTFPDILVKPTACKNEIVNIFGNLIWWVPRYSTVLLLWKPVFNTDKLRLLKDSWNRRPLSFTTRFSITLFSRRVVIPSSWRGRIEISKTNDFSGIFTFEMFVPFTVENVFWWILFTGCITTNNS